MKDSELATFLRAERSLGQADDEGRADVLSRLESTLGLPPGGGGSGGGDGGSQGGAGGGNGGAAGGAALRGASAISAAKVAGLLLFGFVAGAVTHAAVTRGPAPVVAVATPQATTIEPPAEAGAPVDAAPLPVELRAMAASDLPDAPSAPPAPARAPEERRPGDLDTERTLLETARTALVRGDSAHALEALERHRARFPSGQLREERESLTVYALVAANRKEEAQARAAAFHRAFPRSLQGPALDALVGAAP